MCGIAGFVGPGGVSDLDAMMQAVAHRGPDGEGRHGDLRRGLFLGHRRLAVVDIASGAQPMWSSDRRLAVVFNGEIYNHRELRAELAALGRRFVTDHSDTEVLIHGYAVWGEDLPRRLNGMFAFCILDTERQRLFLARDRFGEKPLYLARQGGLFAFASEISAIARHSRFTARFDALSLQKFFAYGFFPAPTALYEDCEKLPGGCYATFDLESRALQIRRYWRFLIEPHIEAGRTEADLADELRARFVQAVDRRLAADVPLGFFLSGGVDSTAVVAAACRRLSPAVVRTFTLAVAEPSYDESAPARDAAAALGVAHAVQRLDGGRAKSRLRDVLDRLDEPSADPSILPTALLAEFARREVTVALSGDGADELFAGYDPFVALAPARVYRAAVPRPLHKLLRRAVETLPRSHRNMSLDFKLRRTLAGLDHPPALWNPVWLGPLEPDAIEEVFLRPVAPEAVYSEALELWSMSTSPGLVDRTLEFYTNYYLQDGILQKLDRATMMVSLEARSPFLDNDLVEFCRRLPHRMKYRNGVRKYLLKRALRGLVPEGALARRKKGFGIPVSKWLEGAVGADAAVEAPGMDLAAVTGRLRRHAQGQADDRIFTWGWASLQAVASRSAPASHPRPEPEPHTPTVAAS